MSGIEDILNASDSDDDGDLSPYGKDDILENILASNSDDEDDHILSKAAVLAPPVQVAAAAANATDPSAATAAGEKQPITELLEALTKPAGPGAGPEGGDGGLQDLLDDDSEDEGSSAAARAAGRLEDSMRHMKLGIQGVAEDDDEDEEEAEAGVARKSVTGSGAKADVSAEISSAIAAELPGRATSGPASALGGSIGASPMPASTSSSTSSSAPTSLLYTSTELGGLEDALRCERAALLHGNKDVHTALTQQMSSATPDEGAGAQFSYVKCALVEGISQQLQRNAHYKQHGPGVATVVHSTAHGSGGAGASDASMAAQQQQSIFVGTSKGMVLVFDLKQSLKQVLGSEIPLQSRCCTAVSALDAVVLQLSASTSPAEYLLVGYVTGEIALFDVGAGQLVKRITDIHNSKIVRLQLVPQGLAPSGADSAFSAHTHMLASSAGGVSGGGASGGGGSGGGGSAGGIKGLLGSSSSSSSSSSSVCSEMDVVSVDSRGVVHKIRLAKEHTGLLAGWSLSGGPSAAPVTFSASSECLLDGGAGMITDLAALPGFRSRTSNSIKAHSPATSILPHNLQLICFNSLTRTYFVQVGPAIKVVHRFVAPASVKELAGSGGPGSPAPHAMGRGSSSANPAPVVSLEWGWVQHRFLAPHIKAETYQAVLDSCTVLGDSAASAAGAALNASAHSKRGSVTSSSGVSGQAAKKLVFHAVLARSWGRNISLVACLPLPPTPAAAAPPPDPFAHWQKGGGNAPPQPVAAVDKKAAVGYQFIVVNEVEFGSVSSLSSAASAAASAECDNQSSSSVASIAPIVCCRWLDNGEGLVALTATEIIMLKVPSLTVRERVPLTASISNSFRITMGGRSADEAFPLHIANSALRGIRYLYVYIAAESALYSCYVQSWTEHMDKLIGESRWLEALSFALKSVNGTATASLEGAATDGAARAQSSFRSGSERLQAVNSLRRVQKERALERRKATILLQHEQQAQRQQQYEAAAAASSQRLVGGAATGSASSLKGEETGQEGADEAAAVDFDCCPVFDVQVADGEGGETSGGADGESASSVQQHEESQQLVEDSKLLDHYLRRYVDLALSPQQLQMSSSSALQQQQQQQRHLHFVRVAGVCIDYCLSIDNTSLLFGVIYDKFVVMQQRHAFLEALEPFITTSRVVRQLPSHLLHSFISLIINSKSSGIAGSLPSQSPSGDASAAPTNNSTLYTLSASEKSNYVSCLNRCLSYLHFARSDIGYVLSYLKKSRHVSPYLYVHGYFLSDFANAFSIGFDMFVNSSGSLQAPAGSSSHASKFLLSGTNADRNEKRAIGYKLLLYLLYCGEGKVFPRLDDYMEQIPYKLLVDLVELVLTTTSGAGGSLDSARKSASGSFSSGASDLPVSPSPTAADGSGSPTPTAPAPAAAPAPAVVINKKTYLQSHKYPYLAELSYVDSYALFYCLSKCTEAILLNHQGFQNTVLLSAAHSAGARGSSASSSSSAFYLSGITGAISSVAVAEGTENQSQQQQSPEQSSAAMQSAVLPQASGGAATLDAFGAVPPFYSVETASYLRQHASVGELFLTLYEFACYMDSNPAGKGQPGDAVGGEEKSKEIVVGGSSSYVNTFMEVFVSQLSACKSVLYPTELLVQLIKSFAYKSIKPKSKLEDFMVLLARNQTIAACSYSFNASNAPLMATDEHAENTAEMALLAQQRQVLQIQQQQELLLDLIDTLRTSFESIKIWRATAALMIALSNYISSTIVKAPTGQEGAQESVTSTASPAVLLSPTTTRLLQLHCSFYSQSHFEKAISSYITERTDIQYKQRVFVFINETFEALYEAHQISVAAVAVVTAAAEDRKRELKAKAHREGGSNYAMYAGGGRRSIYQQSSSPMAESEAEEPSVQMPAVPMHRMFGDACGKILLLLMNADAAATKSMISRWLLHSYHITQLLEQTKKFPLVQLDIMNHIVSNVEAKQKAQLADGKDDANEMYAEEGGGGSNRRASTVGAAVNSPASSSSIPVNLLSSVPGTSYRLSSIFNTSQMLHYIRLLSVHTPDAMLAFFGAHPDEYPIDESLVIVQEKHIYDATAYLYERLGEPQKACDLLLREVSRRIVKIKKDLDAEIRSPAAPSAATGAKGPTMPLKKILTLHNSDPAKAAAVRELSHYDYLSYTAIGLLTGLCSRNTHHAATSTASQDEGGAAGGELLWFRCFDSLMLERQNQRSGMVTSAAELATVLLSGILQDFMNVMRDFVPPQDIVRRIIANSGGSAGSVTSSADGGSGGTIAASGSSGSTLGEFKEVILSMVAADAQEFLVSGVMQKLCAHDFHMLQKTKSTSMRRGKKFDAISPAQLNQLGGASPNERIVLSGGSTSSGSGSTKVMLASTPEGEVSPSTTRKLPSVGAVASDARKQPQLSPSQLIVRNKQKLDAIKRRVRQDSSKPSTHISCAVPKLGSLASGNAVIMPRKPGSLPLNAMNNCEYSGIMMD